MVVGRGGEWVKGGEEVGYEGKGGRGEEGNWRVSSFKKRKGWKGKEIFRCIVTGEG